jgi:hypothetical protein
MLTMLRKSLAILLVCGWVFLSGFDLLEDLKTSRKSNVAGGSQGRNSPFVAGASGSFAHNMIESALRLVRPYTALFASNYSGLENTASFELRLWSSIHKLCCVFLI